MTEPEHDVVATKAIAEFEVKDAERGEVAALVSVLNVVDRDRDVILSGAIKDGAVVKMSGYDHDIFTKRMPPVGRGVLKIEGDRVMFYGKYFMSTERGRDAFETVKELGTDSEWSIGWPNATLKTAKMTDDWREKGARRVISGMNVLEVSPVMLGANQYTRTVATKSAGDAESVDDATAEANVAEVARLVAEQAAKDEQRKQEIIAAVTKSLMDAKAAEDAAAEQKRIEQEQEQERVAIATKAAADAALAAERSRITVIATREFERFQRNMRMAG